MGCITVHLFWRVETSIVACIQSRCINSILQTIVVCMLFSLWGGALSNLLVLLSCYIHTRISPQFWKVESSDSLIVLIPVMFEMTFSHDSNSDCSTVLFLVIGGSSHFARRGDVWIKFYSESRLHGFFLLVTAVSLSFNLSDGAVSPSFTLERVHIVIVSQRLLIQSCDCCISSWNREQACSRFCSCDP